MEHDRIAAWMENPSEVGFRDGLALLRAYHNNDAEGLATLLENCDPHDALKAVISLYEISLSVIGVDPCLVLEGIVIANLSPEDDL